MNIQEVPSRIRSTIAGLTSRMEKVSSASFSVFLLLATLGTVVLVNRMQDFRTRAVGEAQLLLSTSKATVSPGETFEIVVSLQSGTFSPRAATLMLQYDPNVLTPTAFMVRGSIMPYGLGPAIVDKGQAAISLGASPLAPLAAGSGGDLAVMQFRANSVPTTTAISLIQGTQVAAQGYPGNVISTLPSFIMTIANPPTATPVSIVSLPPEQPTATSIPPTPPSILTPITKLTPTLLPTKKPFPTQVPLPTLTPIPTFAVPTIILPTLTPWQFPTKELTTPTPFITKSPLPTNPVSIRADLNGDGRVNYQDYLILRINYGRRGKDIQGDLNGDGRVNYYDYVIFFRYYRKR